MLYCPYGAPSPYISEVSMKYFILIALVLFILYEIYCLAINLKNKKKNAIKEEVTDVSDNEKSENSNNK